MSRFISNSLFGSLCSFSATVGSLATSLVVARVLGVAGTGQIAFAIWIATTYMTVCGLGIPSTLARYLPQFDVEGRDSGLLVRTLLGFQALATLIPIMALPLVATCIAAHQPSLSGGTSDFLSDPLLAGLTVLMCIGFSLAEFTRGLHRGKQSFRRLAKLTATSSIVQFIFAIVGALLWGVPGVLAAYVLGSAIFVATLVSIKLHGAEQMETQPTRLRRYATFRWASDICATFVWSRSEVAFLEVNFGATAVGLFTAGTTLVNLATQGVLMLGWGLLPHFCEHYGQNKIEAMKASFELVVRTMALLTFPACLGLAAILPEVIPLVFGDNFSASLPSATIMVIGAALTGPGTVAVTVSWALERSDIEFGSGVLGALTSLAGGFLIIPTHGLIGAAISRVATQLVFVLSCNGILVRRFGFCLPFADLCRCFLAAAICAGAARLSLAFLWSGSTGLPLAVMAGIVTYIGALRMLRVIPTSDLHRLNAMTQNLPDQIATGLLQALKLTSGSRYMPEAAMTALDGRE